MATDRIPGGGPQAPLRAAVRARDGLAGAHCAHAAQYHAGPGRTVAQLAFSLAARCSWLPCPARAARPWRLPAPKLSVMRCYTGAVWEPYQLGLAVTARCRWSSSVEATWLAGRRSSAKMRRCSEKMVARRQPR
jgi:hypothetical protein